MKLTRREKNVLIVAGIALLFFIVTRPSYETAQEWEWFYLVFVVGPIGFYLATDSERYSK